ncbi:Transmembrane protein [Phytophthora cinnamomi]|uniref:Transmembrane protein n=1 Tax=Phytophthora cinnamomi TaxID=4785 RepID=UPI003559EBD4|nr:Transmembrane protein [Phytophthora cinnamomi]
MVQHLTDRVSAESLTKLKPEDARTQPSGYQIQLEDGSLRPANGSVSAYIWENLGMLTHIAAVGTVYGTVSGVIYSVLNNYLHMSTTLVATTTALVTFPRALRIFTGMMTDTRPIYGYRRPYMIIGWSVSFISCLLKGGAATGGSLLRRCIIV